MKNSATCRLAVTFAALVAIPCTRAGLELNPGTLNLLPNRPNQTVFLQLDNSEAFPLSFGGIDLALEVADPNNPSALPEQLPAITGIDFDLDTVYSGHSPTVDPAPGNTGQIQFWTVSLPGSSGSTPEIGAFGHGRLATLTLDTTGIPSGTFNLRLVSTAYGDTTLYDGFNLPHADFTALNALLFVTIPEPAGTTTVGAAATAIAMGIAFRRRQRRRSVA